MTVRVNKGSFNIREKLTELGRRFGLKGSELAAAETVQEARDLVSAGRKNLLINGSFQIWQRSTDNDNTTTDWGYYAADRYKSNRGRIRQVTATVDGREVKALEISPGASGYNGGRGVLQKVEDYKIYNKVTTLSAYIKSSVPTTAYLGLIYDTGAAATVANSGKTINTTTEFQKFEITNPTFDPSTSPDIYIVSSLTEGVTYTIANAQLEYGRNATEFEHRSYAEELNSCLRYYWKVTGNSSDQTGISVGQCNTTSQVQSYIHLPVPMRTLPTDSDVTESGMEAIQANTAYAVSKANTFDEGYYAIGVILSADSGTPFTAGGGCLVRLFQSDTAFFAVDVEL